jgi:hypothetical protein
VRPSAVLIAIVFGSAAAISFGLITTSAVFLLLKNDYPELRRELWPFAVSCLWFVGLSALSGSALYATLKDLRWRVYAQAGMLFGMLTIGYAYWPRR